MEELKQSLRDFVATSNSGKYKTEDEVFSKFPEFKDYDRQVLRDFVATSNSGKYKTEDEVFSKFPEFFQPADVKKKEPSVSASPSQGSVGSPVSGGQQKTASQPTVESGVPGGKTAAPQVPAAKPGVQSVPSPVVAGQQPAVPATQGQPQAKPSSPIERVQKDITAIRQATTEELVNNYIEDTFGDLLSSSSLYQRSEASQAAEIIRGLTPQIDQIRKGQGTDAEKFAKVQRLIADNVKGYNLSSAQGAVESKLFGFESDLEQQDPESYRKILQGRFKERMDQTGVPVQDGIDFQLKYAVEDVFSDPVDIKEATLRREKAELDKRAAKQLADLDRQVASGQMSKREADFLKQGLNRESQIMGIDAEIAALKQDRLAGYQDQIEDLNAQIVSLDKGPEQERLIAERDLLKTKMDRYLSPTKQVASVMSMYGEEVAAEKGETVMDKLQNYFAHLSFEYNELKKKVDEKGPISAIGQAWDAGPLVNRMEDLKNRMMAVAPIVYFNEAPRGGRGFVAGITESIGESLVPTFMQQVIVPEARQKTTTMNTVEALALAGIDNSQLNPDIVKDNVGIITRHDGLGDSEFWGTTIGGTIGIMAKMMIANKALPIGGNIKSIFGETRAMKYLGEAMQSGVNYSKAGNLMYGDDELTFASGFFGGVGSGLMPELKGMSKVANDAVKSTFGDKAKDAARIMANYGLKSAGAGVGETFEEFGNELGSALKESSTYSEFVGKLRQTFPDINSAIEFTASTFIMGAGMKGAELMFGKKSDQSAGAALINEANRSYSQLSNEEKAKVDEILQAVGEDALDVTARMSGSDAITGEATAAAPARRRGQTVDTNAIQDKYGVTLQVNTETGETEVVANKGTTPDQVEAAKAELAQGGFTVAGTTPVTQAPSTQAQTQAPVQPAVTSVADVKNAAEIETRHGVTLEDNVDGLGIEVKANDGTTPEQVEAAKQELVQSGVKVRGMEPPSVQTQVTSPVAPVTQTPEPPQAQEPVTQKRGEEIDLQELDIADIEDLASLTEEELIQRITEVQGDSENTQGLPGQVGIGGEPVQAEPVEGAGGAPVTAGGDVQGDAEGQGVKPGSKARAYDFDDTLYDPKTGKLTPLGEEVKARIAAGEDITIVTARNAKQTAAITKALGIPKDRIQATGDEAKKGEVLDRLGIAREDYYDADQAKMEAIQGRVPAAPEATMEPTAPVAQAPVTPAQKPAVEPTSQTQGKTQPQGQKTPVKVRVSVDGVQQVGAVTNVYNHPKSGKEVYTVSITDSQGNKTTKDVLAHMADVVEWKEAAAEVKPAAEKSASKPEAKQPVLAKKPAGAVEVTNTSNPKVGEKSSLAAVGMTEQQLEEWQKANKVQQRKSRLEQVQEAVKKLLSGEISFKEYLPIARDAMKSAIVEVLPNPTSLRDVVAAIDKTKRAIGVIGLDKFIQPGTKVGLRLDIPAFNNYGKKVVAVHEGGKPNAIGYGNVASIRNVTFETSVSKAASIAAGENKMAFAKAEGEWIGETQESLMARAEEAMKSPDWVQVSMNPFKHSFFFDRADGNPVVSAEEVIQIGNLVLAKNPVKLDLSTEEGMNQFRDRFSAKTKGGVTYQFRKGDVSGAEVSKEKAAERVKRVRDFFKGSGIEVTEVTSAEMSKIVGQDKDGKKIGGVFFSSEGKVFLNTDQVGAMDVMGDILAFHEATHPVVNIIRNTNPKLYDAIVRTINGEAKTNPEVAKAVEDVKKVNEGESKETIEDETVVEVLARIAAGEIDPSKFSRSFKDRLIDFMNKVANMLGLPNISKASTGSEFKKFADKLTKALNAAEGNIADVVGEEQVREILGREVAFSKVEGDQQAIAEKARKLKELIDSVANLGADLIGKGFTDYASWEAEILKDVSEKLKPWLPKLFNSSKRIYAESQSKAGAQQQPSAQPVTQPQQQGQGQEPAAEPEPAGEEGSGQGRKERKGTVTTDPLSTTGQLRQRGVEKTMLKYPEVGGPQLQALIEQAPSYYEVMDQEEVIAQAKRRIEEEGFEKLMPEILKAGSVDPVIGAIRMLAIQAFSEQAQGAFIAGEVDLADEIMDNVEAIKVVLGYDKTRAGQFTSMMAQFGLLAPYMDLYVESRARAMAKKVMEGKTADGKTKKAAANDAAKGMNEAKKAKAQQIADAVVSTPEVTDAKVDPGRAKVKKELEAAKKELKAALAKSMSSLNSGIPLHNILDVTEAAAKVGYYLVLDGAHTLKDFMKKMKEAGVQDDDFIKDIWEKGEYNGSKIGELAKSEIERKAVESVTKEQVKRTPSESAKSRAELANKIRDAIARHLVEPDGRTLENVLVEDLDLAPESAQKIVQATANKTADELGGVIKQKANSIVSNAAKELTKAQRADVAEAKKSVTGRLLYALVNGDIDGNDVGKAMAEKLGLPADLTPEMRASMRAKAQAIKNSKEGSKVREAAQWEFAKEADAALQYISRGNKNFFARIFQYRTAQIYNSLVYAAMLNGIPTHAKNFLSVVPDIFRIATLDMMNIPKWVRAVELAKKYDGKSSRAAVLMLASPMNEQILRMRFGIQSAKNAMKEASDVWSSGRGNYRWEDQVKQSKDAVGKIIESVPILERTRFIGGRVNPFNNIFGKLVGRALAATDALTSLYHENQELPFAILSERIKAGDSVATINKKINAFTKKADRRWAKAKEKAQADAEAAERLGFKVSEKTVNAEAARLMREEVKGLAGISKERGEDLHKIGRDKIFSLKRTGIMGYMASLFSEGINAVARQNPVLSPFLQIALKPIVPFTNIVGNMADAFIDTLPVYGMLRANGLSGTGAASYIVKNWFGKETGIGTSMMGKSRSIHDDLYVHQMSRAVLGTVVSALVFMLQGDDEDDFIYFSGPDDDPAKAYKLNINGTPIFDYRMRPEWFLPIELARNFKAYKKNPENYDAGFLERIAGSYFSTIMSIKDMSFLDGVSDFMGTIGRAKTYAEEAGTTGKAFEKFMDQLAGGLARQHINFALKPLVTNQAIFRNFEKAINPAAESRQDANEALYHYLGLQSFFNEKKVDVLGNVIKNMPGDDVFPISTWLGLNNASKQNMRVLKENNINIEPSINKIRTFKEYDPETGNDYTQRKFTPQEYFEVSVLAGQKFADKIDAYTSTGQYDDDKNQVFIETGGKNVLYSTKRLQGYKGAAWSEALAEKFGEQILDQDELNLLIGQEFEPIELDIE